MAFVGCVMAFFAGAIVIILIVSAYSHAGAWQQTPCRPPVTVNLGDAVNEAFLNGDEDVRDFQVAWLRNKTLIESASIPYKPTLTSKQKDNSTMPDNLS
jgi:hypothetical protein